MVMSYNSLHDGACDICNVTNHETNEENNVNMKQNCMLLHKMKYKQFQVVGVNL